MKNAITLGKLTGLLVLFRLLILLSILFLKTPTSYRTFKIISRNELARSPCNGNNYSSYGVICILQGWCATFNDIHGQIKPIDHVWCT